MIALMMLVAAANADNARAQLFGSANYSCSTAWSFGHQHASSEWVMGFWSGMNMATPGQNVGAIEGKAIVAAVRRFCKAVPLMPLGSAAFETYRAMQAQRP